jgi:hypothetical protein
MAPFFVGPFAGRNDETVDEMLEEMPNAKVRVLQMTANALDAPEESILQVLQTPREERVVAVGKILQRVPKPVLMEQFKVPFFKTTEEFLESYAKKNSSFEGSGLSGSSKTTGWFGKKGARVQKSRVVAANGTVNVPFAASMFLSAMDTGTHKFHTPFDNKLIAKGGNSWAKLLGSKKHGCSDLNIVETQMKSIEQSDAGASLEVSVASSVIPDKDAVFDIDAEIEAAQEEEPPAKPDKRKRQREAAESKPKKKKVETKKQKPRASSKKVAKKQSDDSDAYDFASDFYSK